MDQNSESSDANLLAGVPVNSKKVGGMEFSWGRLLIAAIIVVVIIIVGFIAYIYYTTSAGSVSFSGFTAYSSTLAQPLSPIAQRLIHCGWVLYVRDQCGYCSSQMQDLHGGYSNAVHYSADGKLVSSTIANPIPYEKVAGFPLWQNMKTGETKVGYHDSVGLERMAKICDGKQ